MDQDEKLEEALKGVAGQMTLRSTRIEIPNAGGLALRMYMESVEGRKWIHLQNPENRIEKIWLQLVDRDGDRLAEYASRGYPFEAIEDGDMLRAVLETLVERLVAGSGQWPGLADILGARLGEARQQLNRDRSAAQHIPQAEKDLADAELAAGWVARLGQEEVSSPAV